VIEDRQPFEDQNAMSNAHSENSVTLVGQGGLADIYLLRASSGIEALITNYGGTVMSLRVPDARGAVDDIVLGHERPEDYVTASPYFGCLVGRYGNRIAKAKFSLDGTQYTLAANNGENSLHGGIKGFDKVVWAARPVQSDLGPALELRYLSKDGEEGFPGNLDVTARYTLTADRGLRLDFSATTDKKTIVNLTHHSYFNLAGKGDILGHKVFLNAKRFTPVDASLISTGELRPVEGTPFDFTTPTPIGARIDGDDEQLRFGGGYDHNWIIDKPFGKLGLLARVSEPTSGRTMEVLSTEPGTQLYTGNYLDGTITGKRGWRYTKRAALCIEPQHYPDTPNQPSFPPVVLVPGETYKNTILYKFSTTVP
jgi:aldose 1-epimerase